MAMNRGNKVIFFGTGSIGMRHIAIIKRLYPEKELYAFRTGGKNDIEGVENLFTLKQVEKLHPEAAFICNPTEHHIETALNCIKIGIPALFIEKPISNSLKDLDKLLKACHKNNTVTHVAYPFRHHPVIKALDIDISKNLYLGRLPDKKPLVLCVSDASKWPSKRKLDHVYLELSHEFDLCHFLFGGLDVVDMGLSISSHFERRFILYDGIVYDYQDKADMYEKQIEYFFKNINNHNIMNNIFEAALIFTDIIRQIK